MATNEQIAALRLLIAEPQDADPYTDIVLGGLLDAAAGSTDQVAYDIWTQKAAAYSSLVDVSESGSSRKLSDLHKNALAMRATFADSLPGTATTSGVRISKLVRR